MHTYLTYLENTMQKRLWSTYFTAKSLNIYILGENLKRYFYVFCMVRQVLNGGTGK